MEQGSGIRKAWPPHPGFCSGKFQNEKGLQLRLGASSFSQFRFSGHSRPLELTRSGIEPDQGAVPRVRRSRLTLLPRSPQAATATTATNRRRAMPRGLKTRSIRNPGRHAHPARGSSADGSSYARYCDKAGLQPERLKETRIGTSGTPWQHLKIYAFNEIQGIPLTCTAHFNRIVHRFSTEIFLGKGRRPKVF
jgi:hypothetical protein